MVNEILPPYRTREKTSRPHLSVPNRKTCPSSTEEMGSAAHRENAQQAILVLPLHQQPDRIDLCPVAFPEDSKVLTVDGAGVAVDKRSQVEATLAIDEGERGWWVVLEPLGGFQQRVRGEELAQQREEIEGDQAPQCGHGKPIAPELERHDGADAACADHRCRVVAIRCSASVGLGLDRAMLRTDAAGRLHSLSRTGSWDRFQRARYPRGDCRVPARWRGASPSLRQETRRDS